MTKEIILVTGSCGRIGTSVIEKLKEKYFVIGLELPNAIHGSCSQEVIPIDLASDESVHGALEAIRETHGNQIRSVIHLAAYYSFSTKQSDLYEQITVQGTERLLKELQNFDVEQFIFTSTMLVHAPTKPGTPITEDSPVVPKWAYPLSKVQTEKKIQGTIPSVILRIAGVYDDDCHSIPISHQIQRIYEKKLESYLFAGNITRGSSFVHMDDVTDAIVLAVEKRKELPQELTLLIGEETTLSYDEMQKTISSLLTGKEMKTYRVPKWFAKIGAFLQNLFSSSFIQPWMIDFADDHYELNIERAKKELGWSPKHTLKETFPKMIQRLKENPTEWYRQNGL